MEEMKIPQEQNKYYREIPQELKLKCVMEVLAKKKKVKEICREMSITRETFREWKKKAVEGMAKAVLTTERRGRKPKDYVPDDDLGENREDMLEERKDTKKEIKILERKIKKAEKELWMLKHVTKFFEEQADPGWKKNAALMKRLEKIYSEEQKRPFEAEEA